MGFLDKLAFWKKSEPRFPLDDWYNALPYLPYRTLQEAEEPLLFTYEQLKLPPVLHTDSLIIYNGARSPGATALHIEHIAIYGGKTAFRMLGLFLIAAALRIKYDEPVSLHCTNKELSPCLGIKIAIPRQSKLEQELQLAPGILTQWSWTPSIPEGKPVHCTRELDNSDYPSDHLPWLRLGSEQEVYSEHHRPRSDQTIITHLNGTLPSLCWLGRALLNFALEDNPCHTLSLLNYGGHSSLAKGSAELRCITPGGTDIPPAVLPWLNSQQAIDNPTLEIDSDNNTPDITLEKVSAPTPEETPPPSTTVVQIEKSEAQDPPVDVEHAPSSA